MSCSGMRYARELDEPRADLAAYGSLKLIRGAIVLSWEKYGVHLARSDSGHDSGASCLCADAAGRARLGGRSSG